MSTIITSVDRHSPAERAGITPGEQLLTINGHQIIDVLDYRFYGYDTDCRLELREPSGAVRTVSLRKPEGRDLGLNFDTVLMDEMRSCANHCIFCFVDQMPPGMRKTLYFKDDDARLSFLQGNFVTLTNMSDADVERVIQWRLEPMNVSLHAVSPECRARLMGRNAQRGMDVLERLCDLRGKMQGFSPVEPAFLLEILLERNALDELHNNIIEVIRVRHVVHAHNVRVREHRDGLRLGMEPAAELFILRELLL